MDILEWAGQIPVLSHRMLGAANKYYKNKYYTTNLDEKTNFYVNEITNMKLYIKYQPISKTNTDNIWNNKYIWQVYNLYKASSGIHDFIIIKM